MIHVIEYPKALTPEQERACNEEQWISCAGAESHDCPECSAPMIEYAETHEQKTSAPPLTTWICPAGHRKFFGISKSAYRRQLAKRRA